MTNPDDETMWRNRFILFNLTRIGGTILVLVALMLWQCDLIVEGGHIAGFPLALLGLAISILGPQYLARRWRTPPDA